MSGRLRRRCHTMLLRLLSMAVLAGAVELVSYATDPEHEGVARLRRTARWHGWAPLHVIGTPEGYAAHGLVDKLRALRRFARRWPDDMILAFADGYDVIANNGPGELERAFLATGKPIVIASELGCCTDKASALRSAVHCHRNWPFRGESGRVWLNTGVVVGYARAIRRLLRLAWREYRTAPAMYRAYTDQQVLCALVAEGATPWTRASVAIDHGSELALTTYNMLVELGHELTLDARGRIVFLNETTPALIHFNGPPEQKAAQLEYARAHFPLLSLH